MNVQPEYGRSVEVLFQADVDSNGDAYWSGPWSGQGCECDFCREHGHQGEECDHLETGIAGENTPQLRYHSIFCATELEPRPEAALWLCIKHAAKFAHDEGLTLQEFITGQRAVPSEVKVIDQAINAVKAIAATNTNASKRAKVLNDLEDLRDDALFAGRKGAA